MSEICGQKVGECSEYYWLMRLFKEKSLPVKENGKSTRYAVEIVTGRNSDDEITNVEYLTILLIANYLKEIILLE